ncbi:hypothetical protein, partial [Parafilimonas sp.]|uniref:hypothetical protein n=1 Tax=Parafilimonas sp. TaxID=1969739 RepID=UPI003F7E1104
NEKKSKPLYKINADYFKTNNTSAACPRLITVAFRYVSMPLSLNLMDNFSKNFDFHALQEKLE